MTTILALVLLTLVAGTAEARIVKVVIDRTEPFAASSPFGTAGAYVRITGTAYGDLDPARPENAVIVNLEFCGETFLRNTKRFLGKEWLTRSPKESSYVLT